MIALSMTRTCDEYRRGRIARAPACPAPAHPVRRALMRALSLLGVGLGGVGALDDDVLGIG